MKPRLLDDTVAFSVCDGALVRFAAKHFIPTEKNLLSFQCRVNDTFVGIDLDNPLKSYVS